MDLEYLGNRIRDAREKRHLSRLRVVQKIDEIRHAEEMISERTLIRWEQGESQPKPVNLHDLASVLAVAYEEEIYWLGLAGYLTPTRLPEKERIISVLDIYYKDICNHPYPAIITDYGSHLWAMNPATIALTNGYDHATSLIKNFSTFLDIQFDTELGFIDKMPDNERFQRRQIYAFLLNNLHRRHEPLWQRYPEIMKKRLLAPGDYEHFEKVWKEICGKPLQFEGFPDEIVQELVESGYLRYKLANGSEVVFKIMSDSSGYFYGNLFQIMRYFPATEADYALANGLLSSFQNVEVDKLKVWKVRDLDEILKKFE